MVVEKPPAPVKTPSPSPVPNDPLQGGWSANYGATPTATVPSGNTPANAGGSTAADIYIPSTFSRYAGQTLPGRTYDGGSAGAAEYTQNRTPPTGTFANTLQAFFQTGQQDETQTLAIQEQLIRAGYLNPKDRKFNPGQVVSGDASYYAFARMLRDSLQSGTYYEDLLNGKVNDPKNALGIKYYSDYKKQFPGGAAGAASQAGNHVQTTTSISSPEDAQQLAEQTFTKFLGRKPKADELGAFQKALQTYEGAHPNITNYSTDAAGNTNTTATTGGANPGQFAENYVDQNYGTQVGAHDALHYFDQIVGALTGPPGGAHVA